MAKRQKTFKKPPVITIPENPNTSTIAIRPRIMATCRIYNISDSTLLDFLFSIGYRNLNRNSLLDEKALLHIEEHFGADKIAKDKLRGKTKIEIVNPASPDNVTNSNLDLSRQNNELRSIKIPMLQLSTDIFSSPKQEIRFKNHETLQSHFTDIEAVDICSKMSSSFTRRLCKQLNGQKGNKQLILYQLHHIANKALKIFGGKILTFIYGLRKLNFRNMTANEIRTYSKVIPDFPVISFETGDTSFKISFFAKQSGNTGILKSDIRVFSPLKNECIGFLDQEGNIMTRLEEFRPQLTMFHQASQNNRFKIFSGVETGSCDICGRALTHPFSLRTGIGPVCAGNMHLDRRIYNFK